MSTKFFILIPNYETLGLIVEEVDTYGNFKLQLQ